MVLGKSLTSRSLLHMLLVTLNLAEAVIISHSFSNLYRPDPGKKVLSG